MDYKKKDAHSALLASERVLRWQQARKDRQILQSLLRGFEKDIRLLAEERRALDNAIRLVLSAWE